MLSGKNSRGLIKTRVALEGEASSEVINIAEGNAKGARGHMDCMEIAKDKAIAKAIPIVNVSHPLAKVTHEAAIGSVDKKQLETLMAHGLTPEEAVDVIVKGILICFYLFDLRLSHDAMQGQVNSGPSVPIIMSICPASPPETSRNSLSWLEMRSRRTLADSGGETTSALW